MWIFSFFLFLRCKMTPGPGKASVQSPFVSPSAAACKWQTSHGLAYMLVHTEPIIYSLLLRLKSLVNSFQLELGALSIPSLVRRRCQGRFTMRAVAMKVSLVSSPEAWEAGQGWARRSECDREVLGCWFPAVTADGLHCDTWYGTGGERFH